MFYKNKEEKDSRMDNRPPPQHKKLYLLNQEDNDIVKIPKYGFLNSKREEQNHKVKESEISNEDIFKFVSFWKKSKTSNSNQTTMITD